MPASSPGSVSVPLANGVTAMVSRSDRDPAKRVQIEIPTGTGMFREASWEPGSVRARSLLERGAMLAELDVRTIESAAIEFLAAQAAARSGIVQAEFTPIAVDGYTRGSDERRTFPINSTDDFFALITQPCGPDFFLEWKGRDSLEILDIDWHNAKRGMPLEQELYDLMTNLKPRPFVVHRTSRGFHAIYAPFGAFTAHELATAAMAAVLDNPIVTAYGGTAELITRTRHPQSVHNGKVYGRLQRMTQDDQMVALSCFARSSCSEEEAIETWEHLGLVPGKRYSHQHCPMRPEHRSSSADPVIVHADGIHCFSCQRGWSWGVIRRRAGLPMTTTAETSIVKDAIANWVPHSQVARYFEALAPWLGANAKPAVQADILRTLHSALIKRHFAAEMPPAFQQRMASVFNDFPWVRSTEGMWLHADTLTIVSPKPERIDMGNCSAALKVITTKEGENVLDVDVLKASNLAKNGSLLGWMPIVPMPMSPIWHIHNQSATSGQLLRCRPRGPYADPLKYIDDPTARMPLAECEAIIRRRFPNINMPYLTLLHIARGLGEQGSCQLPIIWATGQTGTGKTSHVHVEAALHDECPENLAGQDESKIRDMLGEAQGRTGSVLLDDLVKAADNKATAHLLDQFLQFILQFNRNIVYHKRHVGMLSITVTTFLVLTDLKQPRAFLSNAQLGRRCAMVPLDAQCTQWSVCDDGQARQGFRNWWRETPELRKAAESWHSWIIDEYMGPGATTEWKHYVERCGFQMLSDYADTEESAGSRHELVRNFIQALLAAPNCEEVKRFVFAGAKEIGLSSDSQLSVATRELVEYNEHDTVTHDTLRLVLEPYQGLLHKLLPFATPCQVQIGKRRARIFVRIREQGPRNHAAAKINMECCIPGVTVQNILLYTQDGT